MTEPKLTAHHIQVKYRLSFATVAAQYTEDLMLNSYQSARFHFETLVFVTSSYYILEMADI